MEIPCDFPHGIYDIFPIFISVGGLDIFPPLFGDFPIDILDIILSPIKIGVNPGIHHDFPIFSYWKPQTFD